MPLECDKNQITPNLVKAGEWQMAVTEQLPNGLKTVVVLASIAAGAHVLVAWAKGQWITYVSMDLLFTILAVLVLQREKKNDEQRENTS